MPRQPPGRHKNNIQMGRKRGKHNHNAKGSQDASGGDPDNPTIFVNEQGEIENIDAFISQQLIVESGRDAEGRPIFAFYAFRFPDPAKQNYDELLEYLFCNCHLIDFIGLAFESWTNMCGMTM